jgi:hypothetical protein
MEQKPRKTRRAVWRECKWCRARGLEPYRSGKLKTLLKHQVVCEADYLLEQKSGERPQIQVLTCMVQRQQCQIAELIARVSVLETRKRRPVASCNHWINMTPKQCWAARKQNAKRYIRAILSEYDGPQKYYKDIWGYFEWYIPKELGPHDILMSALWPILEERDGKHAIRGVETTDLYFMFKQIWGKSKTQGTELEWWIDALEEVGVPQTAYDPFNVRKHGVDLDRAIRKYQATKVRAGGAGLAQGLVGLGRIWRQLFVPDVEHLTVAMSLPPTEELKWGIVKPADQPSSE